jgi:hypothetical protein
MRVVEIRELGVGKRRDTFRQITVNAAQQADQVSSLHLGKACESFGTDFVREIEDPGEDRACLFSQDESAGSAVTGIRPPLDPAVLFHAIDLSNQGHRLDFKQIGETGLIDPFVPSKIPQHFALRASETEKQHRALVESAGK